jgi:hypothetical protein
MLPTEIPIRLTVQNVASLEVPRKRMTRRRWSIIARGDGLRGCEDMEQVTAPEPPHACVCVGVTGHRDAHAGFAKAAAEIEAHLQEIFALIDRTRADAATPFGPQSLGTTRLHTLLVDGTDQFAACIAHERGWETVAPLPFGRELNLAINSAPRTLADARALLGGGHAADAATDARADALRTAMDRAHLFELADQDARIVDLFLAMLAAPGHSASAKAFQDEAATRAALAARVLIEQSDFLIAVWDGRSITNRGGAGDTVLRALEHAAPVLWIDPAAPADWRILRSVEALHSQKHTATAAERDETLAMIVREALAAGGNGDDDAPRRFLAERWHPSSTRWGHAYRRTEALFGGGGRPFRGIVQRYEPPDAIAHGSLAPLSAVIGQTARADPAFAARVAGVAMAYFAWSDGISARLSDAYRGGMVINFVLSALAIVCGILYLPLVSIDKKWWFALVELVLLLAIVTITITGKRRGWHARWFETRRVAEYLRHSPLMLLLGVARAPSLWPQATGAAWPEWFARQTLRGVGLPRVRITAEYLRASLEALITGHILPQRDYHRAKAFRLERVHHNLDRASEWMFALALISVALYLAMRAAAAADWIDPELVHASSKTFTLLGVMFPTIGAGIAGLRYFGDFERFAAISRVTAEKLDAIGERAQALGAVPVGSLNYASVAGLVHATESVVVDEIQQWQSVFGRKTIAVPV